MSRVIFDIETSGFDWESLDEKQQEYLLKFSDTPEKEEQVKQQMALHALTAEVVCIGMLNPDTDKGVVYYRQNEKKEDDFEENGILYIAGNEPEILEKFWQSIKQYQQFITFNGRGFDCPFLLLRSAMLNIKATRNLMPYRYDASAHVDLLEQLTFYGVSRKFSLDFYCKSFGIQSPKSFGISGLDVPPLWRAGRSLDIAKYCAHDLAATKELFNRWTQNIAFR